MQTIEIAHLTLRFRSLRIADPVRRGRLASSLAAEGQRTPVVVHREDETYTLIDGHARVEALQALGEDLVSALMLDMGLAEALALSHRLQRTRKVSAFEEAWLLRVLLDEHGMTRGEIARQMERSPSWVSRRLALVEHLPPSAQKAIRAGRISSQAAMRSLVPLARANAEHCARLVTALGSRRVSVRELQKVYDGWRTAPALVRERIVDAPILWLEATAALSKGVPASRAKAHHPFDQLRLCCEACIRTLEIWHESPPAGPSALLDAWTRACTSFESLSTRMEEFYARLGYADSHPPLGDSRPRTSDDRTVSRDLPQYSSASPPEWSEGSAHTGTSFETEQTSRAHPESAR